MLVCDGCNVRVGWEHRCHGAQAVVRGEQTYLPWRCEECQEIKKFIEAERIKSQLAIPREEEVDA